MKFYNLVVFSISRKLKNVNRQLKFEELNVKDLEEDNAQLLNKLGELEHAVVTKST